MTNCYYWNQVPWRTEQLGNINTFSASVSSTFEAPAFFTPGQGKAVFWCESSKVAASVGDGEAREGRNKRTGDYDIVYLQLFWLRDRLLRCPAALLSPHSSTSVNYLILWETKMYVLSSSHSFCKGL